MYSTCIFVECSITMIDRVLNRSVNGHLKQVFVQTELVIQNYYYYYYYSSSSLLRLSRKAAER